MDAHNGFDGISTGTIPLYRRVVVAIQVSGKTATFYINGASDSSIDSNSIVSYTPKDFTVGGDCLEGLFLKGSVDATVAFPYSLQPTQIINLIKLIPPGDQSYEKNFEILIFLNSPRSSFCISSSCAI